MTEPAMNILFVIDSVRTAQAGTENQLFKLIDGLSARGHSVRLCCLWETEWLRDNKTYLNCELWVAGVQYFKRPATYLNILRLARTVRNLNPDIVHAFFPTANVITPVAARLAGVKCVFTSRRDLGLWHSFGWLTATSFANMFVSGIVANSNAVRERTERTEKFARGKTAVLYNGIDLEYFKNRPTDNDETFRAAWNIPAENRLIGIVANLRPVKRHETFLRAAQRVSRHRSDVTFMLAGEGDLRSELESLCRDLGISDNVVFLGRVENVGRVVPLLDVGVSAGVEGFSNAVIEYMLAGVVPIVAARGGNLELVEDGVNGFTFPLDDDAALARSILDALDNPEQTERFRRESAVRLADLSTEKMVARFEDFYRDALGLVAEGQGSGRS